MRLRTKFLVSIGPIITLAFGITFYKTQAFQSAMIYEQAERQAKMLAQQIVLTRQWVADHNGVFLLMQRGSTANPFLEEPVIMDKDGKIYLKNNPAMVTRQLSEYADRAGLCRFRVTSLEPINPGNKPDAFERRSLEGFLKGSSEAIAIEKRTQGRTLRYIKSLVIDQSCLECHQRHGYKLGDFRGGLSLDIPLDWADKKAAANFQLLLLVDIISIVLVYAAIFLLIERTVVQRLHHLAHYLSTFPDETDLTGHLLKGNDEISELGKNVIKLEHRLLNSQQTLEQARERMFQAEKLAALGRLSAGVAHEINNPLGGMLNCVKIMKEKPDAGEVRGRYLDLLESGLKRIELIIRQLLNFSRREPLRYQPGMIDDIIRESTMLLKYKMHNIKLILDLGINQPLLIDVEALRQVVMNIIMNGLQAMPGGGTFDISTSIRGDLAMLRFRDSGTGIAGEILDKIFDPFFTTKTVGEGTGMGLAVSHTLVSKMGGTITVHSKAGQGCEFIVTIPTMKHTGPEQLRW